MKKLFAIIACAALLPLAGCWAPSFVNVTSEAVRINVENNPAAPYKIEGVDRNLSASDAVDFLNYYYYNQRDDSYRNIIYANASNGVLADDENFKLALTALSRKYNINVFTVQDAATQTSSKSAYPMLEVRDSWNKYRKKMNIPADMPSPPPAEKSN